MVAFCSASACSLRIGFSMTDVSPFLLLEPSVWLSLTYRSCTFGSARYFMNSSAASLCFA